MVIYILYFILSVEYCRQIFTIIGHNLEINLVLVYSVLRLTVCGNKREVHSEPDYEPLIDDHKTYTREMTA